MKIWKKTKKREVFVKFNDDPQAGDDLAWLCDQNGDRLPGGKLLYLNFEGEIVRGRGVGRSYADAAGVPLDSCGRWKLF